MHWSQHTHLRQRHVTGSALPSDECGRTFGDAVDGRNGVGGDDGRHHRGVGHPQSFDSVHAKTDVDDGHVIGADPACSHVMGVGPEALVRVGMHAVEVVHIGAGQDVLDAPWLQGGRTAQGTSNLQAGGHHIQVAGIGVVVGVHERRRGRVGAGQSYRAAAGGSYRGKRMLTP